MLHGLFSFFQLPMFDEYDISMGIGYVSDARTQFRQLDPAKSIILEEK